MLTKKLESDTTPDTVQTVIEHIQPKQCCIHPHEWCTPSKDFVDYQQKSKDKQEFRKKKIEELHYQKWL